MGYPMHYNNTGIWDELRHVPGFHGALREEMGKLGFIQWPCRRPLQMPSRDFLSVESLIRTVQQFFTCDWVAPIRQTHRQYPMVLSAVREVGHRSCRSMTGNCAALAAG